MSTQGGSAQAGTTPGGSAQGGTTSTQGGATQAGASQGGTSPGGTSAAAGSSSTAGASGGGGQAGSGGSAAGTDTWESYAKGFMGTYCVSCHNDDNAGTATRNYHMLDVVKAEGVKIACGVSKSQADWTARGCTGGPAARQFPAGNGAKPMDAERDRLLKWIDAGMP